MKLTISLATILAIGVAVSAQQPKPAPSPAHEGGAREGRSGAR